MRATREKADDTISTTHTHTPQFGESSCCYTQITAMDNAVDNSKQSAPEADQMVVPRERVAAVIGNRGIVIQEIMRRSGTKITINQKVEPNVAEIIGRADQNLVAKDLIKRVMESGPGGLEDSSLGEIVCSTMECPQGCLLFINLHDYIILCIFLIYSYRFC